MRKLFKGGNYSRAETIRGNMVISKKNCTPVSIKPPCLNKLEKSVSNIDQIKKPYLSTGLVIKSYEYNKGLSK